MGDTTVVVPDTDDQGSDDGVAFAAGVAAATSQQAAEEAEEASQEAEVAVSVAQSASETAWAAREDVDGLRAEMLAGLDEIRGMVGGLAAATAEVIEEEESAPAPGPKDEEPASPDTTEKSHGDEKPAERGYGAKRWFG